MEHIRRSASQIRALLKQREQNNQTVKEFCKRHQIHKSTFYNWQNRYGLETEKPRKFVPVQFSDLEPGPTLFAEIELSSKVVVRLFDKVDPSFFKALL